MKTYPLLESQLGIVIEWMKDPSVTRYNLPCCVQLPKKISLDKIEDAFKVIVATRKELRTRFVMEDGEIRQYSDSSMMIPIVRHKMSDEQARLYISSGFIRPYALFDDAPLARIELIEVEEHNYILLDIHHSISDGLTLAHNLSIIDLPAAYKGEPLEAVDYGMYEHAIDEKESFGTEQYEKAKQYYAEKFAGIDFTTLAENAESPLGNMIRESAFMDAEVVDSWCEANRTKSNLLFMAAFSMVMSRFTRTADVAYRSINHGRIDKRIRNAYGMFVKSVPILTKIDGKQKTIDFINSLRGELMSTIRHAIYPFSHFCQDLNQTAKVNFGFQGVSIQEFVELEGEHCRVEQLPKGKINDDMSCVIFLNEGNYEIRLESSDALNTSKKLRQVAEAIKICVESMMANPDSELSSLKLLREDEEQRIIEQSKGELLDFNRDETFVDLFLNQVAVHGDCVAVADDTNSLTYRELNHRSNVLANKLLTAGIKPDSFVCLLLDRTVDFPTAVLGVQKVAAAYTPLDVEYPIDRISYMLNDSEAKVLLTTHDVYASKCEESLLECENIILLDDIDYTEDASPINLAKPENLAYMIYTSGSTGKPKGTMLSHGGLANFTHSVIEIEQLTSNDITAAHRSFSFDAHIGDLYPILAAGGQMHIMPSSIRKDLSAIRDFIVDHGVTGTGFTTSLMILLLKTYPDMPLRFITAGGEKLANVHSDHITIINLYGPTECTNDSVTYTIHPGNVIENIPIGKPLPNIWCFIISENGDLLPQGIAGELCIAGPQVGRGYWKKEELTAEKFVACPFIEGERMYHTGDLCRYNEEGILEYLGRIDNQVKLRGYRIELGEVESVASKFEGMKSVAAVVKKNTTGTAHLCLYYTAENKIDNVSLKDFLGKGLAEYMLPDYYIQMEQMPTLPNGKINRRVLPDPEFESEMEMVSPADEQERLAFETVAEILGTSDFGVTDNLFQMGLTSLNTIKLVSNLQNNGINVDFKTVKSYPTIRGFLKILNECPQDTAKNLPPLKKADEECKRFKAMPPQDQIYMLLKSKGRNYSVSSHLIFDLSIDVPRLVQALRDIIDNNPILRAAIVEDASGVFLEKADLSIDIDVLNVSESEIGMYKERFIETVNRFGKEVCTFHILKSERSVHLLCRLSHLITDLVGMDIFLTDLQKFYRGLDVVPDGYDYFDWLAYTDELERSDYAQSVLNEFGNSVADFPAAENEYERRETILFRKTFADEEAINELRKFAYNMDCSLETVLMAVFSMALNKFYGKEKVVYQAVSHGRMHPAIVSMLGCFTKGLPILSVWSESMRVEDYLQAFKAYLGKAEAEYSLMSVPIYNTYSHVFEQRVVLNVHAGLKKIEWEGLRGLGEGFRPKGALMQTPLMAIMDGDAGGYDLTFLSDRWSEEELTRLVDGVRDIIRQIKDKKD